MLIVFLVFDQFVWKPQRVAALEKNAATETVERTSEPVSDNESEAVTPSFEAGISAFKTNDIDENITLSNDLVTFHFSNRGASISQVELHNFKMRDGSNVQLIPQEHQIGSISLIHPAAETDLSMEIFGVSHRDDRNLIFYLSTDKDSVVVIRYSLNDDYGLDLDVSVDHFTAISGISISFEAGIADTEENIKTKSQDYKFYLSANNELLKTDMRKLNKEPNGFVSTFSWAAIRSKYFTLAIQEHEPTLIKNYHAKVNPVTDSPSFVIDSVQRTAKSNLQLSFTLYMGPADPSLLRPYGKGMENIAELGYSWLRWLSGAFAWFLKWLHTYIRNYGIVIIIFSLLLKLILHPLTHKQLDSSLKMQRIQPQVQEIQKKYKGDPKRMQTELSQLYKDAGTSPLSGCLPLLLQMPIFFSLYSVLRYSLDMRNAHFVGWLKDLSEPDPFMILPIIMGVFMVLQSLLMRPPQANIDQMDEKQKAAAQSAKMMTWIMPVMMFFIFRNMPAGLVLYWTVFNIFSVLQQYYLQKRFTEKDI